MKRAEICRRLRIDENASSYRLIGTTRGKDALINTDTIVDLLNRSRQGNQPIVLAMPDETLTADEAMERIDCGLTGKQLLSWCGRRRMHIPPHWRITSHTRRFDPVALRDWLYSQSSIVRIA